jgi:hypothetical protein
VGNPPFSNAEEHIRHGLTLAPQVVFTLPVSRLETTDRARFYHRESTGLEMMVLFPERIWDGSRHIGVFRFLRGHTGDFRTRLDPDAVKRDAA